ncbi:MAG: MFS transporter [Hyphomicrobium sp.]
MPITEPRGDSLRRIPRGVWALGLVSLFMDVSSEMIHALLPVYLVAALGASVLTVGFIEGLAEATAMITKIFSGALSDWLGRRKLLAIIGYGLAAFTKPIFPLATSIDWLVLARFLDRIGKGIRGAPRDALVADLTPPDIRGASYGLRQSLDTIGAFLGPLLAIGFMTLTADNFTAVFWIAVVPAFIALALMVFGVEEPQRNVDDAAPVRLADARRLSGAFWAVTAVAGVLALARFSEAFLILKAHAVGLSAALVPAVLVVMNVAYALSAYPAGALSDRIGRRGVLLSGVGLLILADLVLAFAGTLPWVAAGTAVWGLHMGFTQGLLATLVADTAPEDLRGTAFGAFNFVSGIAMLLASVIAGALWDGYGPRMTFLVGATVTSMAFAGLAAIHWRRGRIGAGKAARRI